DAATGCVHRTGLDRHRHLHRRHASLRQRPPIHRQVVDPRRRPSHPPRRGRRVDRQRTVQRPPHPPTTPPPPTDPPTPHHPAAPPTPAHPAADHPTTHLAAADRRHRLGGQPRLRGRCTGHLRRPHLPLHPGTHLTGRLGTAERTRALATNQLTNRSRWGGAGV